MYASFIVIIGQALGAARELQADMAMITFSHCQDQVIVIFHQSWADVEIWNRRTDIC
jgi:hypothetical protein